jgi:DNA repair exonuclease SbcCD ATPase subunit
VDEGLGTLDSENLQSAFLLFSYLKTQFDFIILISHLDIARDFVDKIMEIKKKDGFSYLNF